MKQEKKFEEMIQELENIAKDLENGELTLDESVSKFEQGIEISKECSKILENAEKRISILIKDNDNNIVEEKFDLN